MWCSHCQQDVPALAMAGDRRGVGCARCGAPWPSSASQEVPPAANEAVGEESSLGDPAWRWDEPWLDDDLDEARRLVRRIRLQTESEKPATAGQRTHGCAAPPRRRQKAARGRGRQGREGGGLLGWTAAGLGLAGLVCGCVLVVWSLIAERPDLWNIGLPAALISQAVLACGVLLQFDRSTARRARRQMNDNANTTVTHLHVHAGGMQPSGVSVHYGNSPQQQQIAPPNMTQLEREIEAALRRHAA